MKKGQKKRYNAINKEADRIKVELEKALPNATVIHLNTGETVEDRQTRARIVKEKKRKIEEAKLKRLNAEREEAEEKIRKRGELSETIAGRINPSKLAELSQLRSQLPDQEDVEKEAQSS